MAVTIEQFIQGLEQSGIISPENLRAVCEKLQPECKHDAQELARELVRQKILTTYQVKEAYQGKAKDLVLGNYTILDTIGAGGMGQVFKAQHRKMKRLVAIKLLPASMTKDQAATNRFQREVEAAAKLNHPNIVTAHDADEAAGRHFLVMEYVEGQDLSALVKKNGPLPIAKAVNYVLQAARGLEFAHGEGVVHRDIKPANLLLDKKGVVKILDMGLARLESAAGAEHAELTGTGQIMGTIDYMSPEQALDTKHANERSDIYSLGCTLWYLLTGRAAYSGESVMAKLLAHREQPIPSLQAACPGATPALETVFTKMMAKKEEDRYQSMSAVVADMERFHSDPISAGLIHDDQGNDQRLSEFLRGTKGSRVASGRTSLEPAVAMKLPSSPVLEATITMADGQIETDPKTEQSLIVADAIRPIGGLAVSQLGAGSGMWRNWRIPRRPSTGVLVAGTAGAAALLLTGIVWFLVTRQGTVSIEINDPAIEVIVDGKGAIKGAKRETITLEPGQHRLRIKYGELDFETDKFILSRGDTIALKVVLFAGRGLWVWQGNTLLGEGLLPAIAPFDAKQALAYQQAWAKHLGKRSEIKNSLGMKLRLIPPGEFTMGSPQGPQKRVQLTKAFYLGSCEVTQQEYQKVVGVNPSYFSFTGPGKDVLQGVDTNQHPVEQVSWFDAIDFCNKLSEKEQRSPYYVRDGEVVKVLGGTGYRLPTEAEWEYACRAGTTSQWYFGDNEQELAKYAWNGSNAGGTTHQVGGLPADPFGLYDLYGNVWEWCWDWHGQYAAAEGSDPTGAKTGSRRVYRGGSWNNEASTCRTTNRNSFRPTFQDPGVGFRVARTIEAKGERLPPADADGAAASDATSVNPPLPAIAPFDAQQAGDYQEAWARHLDTSVEIENSLGMKLRLIPPGEFLMGSPQDEIDALLQSATDEFQQLSYHREGPQHRVKLTQSFYLGSCEMTQQQYQSLMGVNPSHFSPTGPGKDAVQGLDTNQHPVELVSWFDAIDFCNKLSEKEQRSPYYLRDGEAITVLGGIGYRLPTEAEWEFACRAGTTTRWSFGDNETNLTRHAWFRSNAGSRTHPVDELPANPFGLHDLNGNAWEWCWDWRGEYTAGAASDPTGPDAGSARVLRGGAFDPHASFCRSAFRLGNVPVGRNTNLGFRVARTIEAKGEVLPIAATDGSAALAKDTEPDAASVKPPESAIASFDAKQALAHQEAWAKHLGTKVEIENSLGMKLRLIPPGEFLMGSPQDEIDALVQSTTDQNWKAWFRSEGPQHRVQLTQAFYLGSCEVTQRQYQELMGVNPSHFSLSGPGKAAVKDLASGEYPVDSVSWFDAIDFCNKLSEKEMQLPYYVREGEAVKVLGGAGYRLPTEAEWEYACRAGTTTRWSFGDDDAKLVQHAWFNATAGDTTHRVGQLLANDFGLFDMHGNVFEWCLDWHGEYPAETLSDPVRSSAGSAHLLRGGAYTDSASGSRSTIRLVDLPMARGHDGYGFRVTRTIEAQSGLMPTSATGSSAARAKDADPVSASTKPPEPAIAPFNAKQAQAHQAAWAKHLGTKVEIENSLGMKLRLIPPGEFMMGSPQVEIDALVATTTEPQWWQDLFRSEGPQHRVKLTQAFYLGNCEVTQQQYQELMGVNPSHYSHTGQGKDAVKDLETSQHPVDSVSWFDAVDFCNKLSEKERRPPYYMRDGEAVKVLGGTGYRLPTEAEWEYACRAGSTTRWSFGDTERDLAQHAWFPANSNGRTQRVGELPANPFGLHDLYGNVWEWCWDWHGKYAAGAVNDPMGSAAGLARVVRGGAYNGGLASYCRSAIRGVDVPVSLSRYGFRVCCGR